MTTGEDQIITEPVLTDAVATATSRTRVVSRPVPTNDRQRYFDNYWETRQLTSVDSRTRLRIGLIDRMLGLRSGRMLDVGCGRGSTAAYFAESGFDVTAIDLSPLAVEWTRRQHHKIKAAVVDLETDAVNGQFDVALCLEVLQQVREPIKSLKKIIGSLADGGEVYISLPNEFHLSRRLSILRGRVDFGGIEDSHIKLYTVAEHQRLIAACGLEIVETRVQSVIPPRWFGGRPHAWCNRLAAMMPGLFALSVVYKCRVGSHRQTTHDIRDMG
jgi:2-polyprenyl-3-methyl-5-hydroxy-6-metoxy-1,4-benzoquinol methylase